MENDPVTASRTDTVPARRFCAALAEACPEVLLVLDARGRVLLANARARTVHGEAAEGLTGQPYHTRFIRDSRRAAFAAGLASARRGEPVSGLRAGIRTGDGRSLEFAWDLSPVPGEDGAVVAVGRQPAVRSVEALTAAWNPARMVEDVAFRLLFQNSPLALALADRDGRYIAVNGAMCRLLGYDEAELTGMGYADVTHPDDRRLNAELAARAWRGEVQQYSLEKRYVRKDGQVIWAQVDVAVLIGPEGRPCYTMAIHRDVSGRKSVEAQLREKDALLQAFLDNSPAAMYVKDLEGRHLVVNRRFEQLTRYRRGQIVGRRDDELFSPAIAAGFAESDREVLRHGRALEFDFPARINGELRLFSTTKFPLRGPDGRIFAVGGITSDVTEVTRMQLALQHSEERLRQITDAIPGLLALLDRRGRYRYANRSHQHWLGLAPDQLVGRPFRDVVGEGTYRVLAAGIQAALHGETHEIVAELTLGSGRHRHVRATFIARHAADNRITGVYVLMEDVSAQQRHQREVLERERVQREALIREVHHRIKNNLQSVIGLLQRQARRAPEARAAIETAVGQVGAVAAVHGLQGRAGDEHTSLESMLVSIVRNVGQITGIAPSLELVRDGAAGDHRVVEAEAVPLALVLNELITNAVKHTPAGAEGGEVVVKVCLQADGAVVEVCNGPAALPPTVDLEAGTGLGTGLQLVRSLLSARGADLVLAAGDDRVRASLRLGPPVLRLVPGAAVSGGPDSLVK